MVHKVTRSRRQSATVAFLFTFKTGKREGDDGDNSHNHDDYKDGKDGKEDVNMIFMTDCDVDADNAEKSDRYIDGHG